MKTRTRAGIALAVGASLALGPALAASAAGANVTNGSFEADDIGSTSITGWTTLNQAIDLGVTSIAGCVTVDTSDYTTLRDYLWDADDDAGWSRYWASVPDQGDYYYVHTNAGTQVEILGLKLVWDDLDGQLMLEIPSEPVTAPAFSLSSVTAEPAPSDPAPAHEDTTPAEPESTDPGAGPEQTAPGESALDESAPSEPASDEPAPSEPAPATEPVPVAPAAIGPTYLPQSSWSTDHQAAFDAAVAAVVANAVARGDDLANADLSYETYETTVVDGANVGREGSKVLELYSSLEGNIEGYVTHGPAVVSDPFTVTAGRQISLDWRALYEEDDFHVFGYLLNVDTCAQTEVIDATGDEQDWTTSRVAFPSAGTYRFVFVSGSYDQSWGGAAGAYMYIDNISQVPVFSGPGIDLSLTAGVGDYLPGSDVQVSGGGLLPTSPYTLVLRSTPVTVTEGVTDGDGKFLDIVSLPLDITPGAHTITLTAQGPSGPLTQVAYITVGSDGTLLYFSLDGPQRELAFTGPAEQAGLLALAALLTLTGVGAIELERRRRTPFSTAYVR